FTSPRMYTEGTVYNDTTILEKTGDQDDNSPGGNIFHDETSLINTGSRNFMMGNGNPDSCYTNLNLINAGTYRLYFAYNSIGNYVGGDLSLVNTGSSISSELSSATGTDLVIVGDVHVENSSDASNSSVIVGSNGTLSLNNLTITNTPALAGTTGSINVGNGGNNTTLILGNCDVLNNGLSNSSYVYIGNSGSVNISGDFTIDNNSPSTNGDVYVANNASSAVQVDGVTSVSNTGGNNNKRVYLGNSGSIVFNDSLVMTNSATAA